MKQRFMHVWLAFTLVPVLMFSAKQRKLFNIMRRFVRNLPTQVQQPMPIYMAALGNGNSLGLSVDKVRRIADLAALIERNTGLGICLRRSLVRYHFLAPSIPLQVQFGARFDNSKQDRRIAGHAWVTLHEAPYYEADENWHRFCVLFTWPQVAGA